ncbi:MAG: hypothetical protein ACI86M_002412 [Saprospiraceae bacterium]|jgi:hypothetical protein
MHFDQSVKLYFTYISAQKFISMQSPKVISYLRTFSDNDWKSYVSYAKSVYNASSSQAQVISYYKTNKSRLSKPDWDRLKLLNSIKPSLTPHALSNVLVKLTTAIEGYFVYSEVQSNEFQSRNLLMQSYAKRGLKKDFFKLKDDMNNSINEAPISLWDDFYKLQIEHLTYFENMTNTVTDSRIILEGAIFSINNFYDKLASFYELELVNREITIKEDWSEENSKLKPHHSTDEISEICTRLISLKRETDQENYDYLKRILENDNFSRGIKYAVLIHLTSYLNHQIKIGDLHLSNELLNLYKRGIDSGLLINNGKIPSRRFYNILNLACGSGAFDWAEDFVENHAQLVDSSSEEETKILAKSEINFKKGNYDFVIDKLVTIKYRNFDHELKARWLLICSEFELNRDNIPFIEDRVRSMNYYLMRNEKNMDVFAFEGVKNLCKFLVKLAKPNDPAMLENEIIETEYLVYRGWLLSKLKK